MHMKISSVKWWPFCPVGDELSLLHVPGYPLGLHPGNPSNFHQFVTFWCVATSENMIEKLGCLTFRGRVMHICVSKRTIIGSDNGLSPGCRKAIIWTNAGISLIGPLGTNFSKIPSAIRTFSFKKIQLKMASEKWRPFCIGLHVSTHLPLDKMAAILQTIFSDAFSWITSFEFIFKIHWSLFPRVQLTTTQHWSTGLAPKRRQANIWTNADMIHWCIYAALGEDELTHWGPVMNIYVSELD